MERRLEYFEKQLHKFGLEIEDNGEIGDYLATIKANKAITSEQLLTSLESLLEENENRFMELKAAIEEGIGSGEAVGFDTQEHLKTLKTQRQNG